VIELGHGIDEVLLIDRFRIHRIGAHIADAKGGSKQAFAQTPAAVGAGNAQINLFDLVLPDIGDNHHTRAIEGEMAGTAWELKLLCEGLYEMEELYTQMEIDEPLDPTALQTVCHPASWAFPKERTLD